MNGFWRLHAPVCQWLLNHSIADVCKLSIDEFRIYPNAHLELRQLKISSQHPAVQTVRIQSVQIALSSLLKANIGLRLDQMMISPPPSAGAVNTAQNSVKPILLDQVQLDLLKDDAGISIPSMTAVMNTWTLRGSIKQRHQHPLTQTQKPAIDWPQLHSRIDHWIREYQSISQKIAFEQPVVHFCIEQGPNGSWDAVAQLEVEKAHIADTQLREIDGQFHYQSLSQNSAPQCTLLFRIGAAELKRDALQLEGKSITGFSQKSLAGPETSLQNLKISLNSPKVIINQLTEWNVPTMELQMKKSGLVNLQGVSFLEQRLKKMPAGLARFEDCSFGTAPKIDFCLDYSLQNDEIHKLTGELDAQAVQVQNLQIDHLHSAFSWQQLNQELQLHQASLRRGQEWVELEGTVHLARKDYRLAVEASTIPTDYNPIMPDWWNKVLRDIKFLEQPICNANFEVVGRLGQRVADFFYGSVQAQNLAYRGVPIDSGQLQLRGRQHYSEINQLMVRQGAHRASGSIQIAALPDPIKAPLFWSLDVDSTFPLAAYQKLVSPKLAAHIQSFQASQAPEVHFKGKFFTKHYPQYRPYMHFEMQADSHGRIHYQNVPFDSLQFKLVGNAQRRSIHDLHAEIANGYASAQIDFNGLSDQAPSMRIKAAIQECDTKKLLKMFHEAERATLSNLAPVEESPSKIDLEVHLQGPTGNWFGFNGYGRATIQDNALGSIKLLGPLSSLLQKTPLNFTSLKFKTLDCDFELAQSSLNFNQLTIGGHSSQIEMKGRYHLEHDSLDMFATLQPLINYADKLNPVTPLNRLIQLPISPLFKFKLDGSLQNPRWRSILDPRVLLPIF